MSSVINADSNRSCGIVLSGFLICSMQDRPEIEAVLEMESINSTPRIHTGKSSSTDAEDGVFLTWKDLWVTVVNGKNGRPILQGLTGFARPGILDPHTRKAGDILINGHKQTMGYGTSER
ncbi:hypothetical protein V6Z11_D02G232000 [Gossypium hirsutum]